MNNTHSSDLLTCLLQAQQNIKKKLAETELLKDILSKFSSNTFFIEPKIDDSNSCEADNDEIFAKALFLSLIENGYDQADIASIIKGFNDSGPSIATQDRFVSWPNYLKNVHEAVQNLKEAELFFDTLKQKNDISEVIPNQLYFKITNPGGGAKSLSSRFVQIDYRAYEPDGSLIASKNREWIDLSQAIFGVVKGINGMNVGETRELYIHPSFAYGVRTLSQKNIHLIVSVTLHDFSEKNEIALPIIEDLSSMLASEWLENEKKRHETALQALGKDLAKSYQSIADVNVKKMGHTLQFLIENRSSTTLNDRDKQILRTHFFNFYQQ